VHWHDIPLVYVVKPNISDYVNMLIRTAGMIPSIFYRTDNTVKMELVVVAAAAAAVVVVLLVIEIVVVEG
jgi:hypothetical protein